MAMATAVEQGRAKDRYVAAFETFGASEAAGPAWLRQVRARAMARFAEVGFPTTRDEEWRFTSVAPIAERAFEPAPEGAPRLLGQDLARFAFAGARAAQVVFVDGRHAPALSTPGALPSGVRLGSLRAALAGDPGLVEPHLGRLAAFDRHAFVALNTALFEDGAFLLVPPNLVVETPIHILHVSATPGAASHLRALLVVGEDSQVRLVESFVGLDGGEYFSNAVAEAFVGPHAVVDHYRVQRESLAAHHVGSLHVHLDRRATFSSHSIALGGALTRHDVFAVLDGEGGECTLNGLYVADGQRLIDNHTSIDHAKPHCDSHEVYKGILAGRAQGVFNGKIMVRPDAQKTDAKQTNRALLLSDEAQINTKPQLEIFADDVKCTHGAAVGQLDEDAIFYLRSRGLDQAQARTILIRAFAGDILDRIRLEPLREQLEAEMLAILPA
jgi:Fe-S cluster assembly protein SufD